MSRRRRRRLPLGDQYLAKERVRNAPDAAGNLMVWGSPAPRSAFSLFSEDGTRALWDFLRVMAGHR